MKATISLLDPELLRIAEDLMKGFALGSVDVGGVDGAIYVHGDIKPTNRPYLESAFEDTNKRFAGSSFTLAIGN